MDILENTQKGHNKRCPITDIGTQTRTSLAGKSHNTGKTLIPDNKLPSPPILAKKWASHENLAQKISEQLQRETQLQQKCTNSQQTSTSWVYNPHYQYYSMYSVRKSYGQVMAPLFADEPTIAKIDIIAIQEPWRNTFHNTTHHPRKDLFELAYLDHPKTRVRFFISKELQLGTLG